MLKLSTKMNQVFWEKNLENENFITAAIHRENWYFKKTNIFHYFPSKNLKYSQIFLSETIHAQENGSRGPHFAKSLNSNFLKGLTYSAMIPWTPTNCLVVKKVLAPGNLAMYLLMIYCDWLADDLLKLPVITSLLYTESFSAISTTLLSSMSLSRSTIPLKKCKGWSRKGKVLSS